MYLLYLSTLICSFYLAAGVSEPCLRDRLRWYEKKKDAYDTFINNSPPKPEEKYFPPYVGNGHLAAALDSRNGLFVRLNRALSVPVKYYPVVTVSIDAAETSLKGKYRPSSIKYTTS